MHSKNRKLDKEEQKHFGRKARLIAVLELAVLGILWYAGQIPYAYAVYTGICITALFMIVGKHSYGYSRIPKWIVLSEQTEGTFFWKQEG